MTGLREACVLGLVSLPLLGACSSVESSPCHSVVTTDPLPSWANAGFSADARVPHVFGERQRIVAVLFAGTLVASASAEPRNKVLLVAREPLNALQPLTVDAQLEGSDEVMHRERASGPGPGTLDLPSAGCWRMTLRWGDETDVLDLDYVASS